MQKLSYILIAVLLFCSSNISKSESTDNKPTQKEVAQMTKLKGQWKKLKGEAMKKWGKLTDDDAVRIDGNKEILVGILMEKYGKTKEDTIVEVEEFIDSFND